MSLHTEGEALLAGVLTTLATMARRARDDVELQEFLGREVGCSIETQKVLSQIYPDMFQQVPFLSKILRIEVRNEYVERARKWQDKFRAEEELIDELILAGATRELIHRWFGLSPKTYQARRRMLGLPPNPGRPKCQGYDDPELIGQVLAAWKEMGPVPERVPERFLRVARKTGQSVCTIHRIIEQVGQLQE